MPIAIRSIRKHLKLELFEYALEHSCVVVAPEWRSGRAARHLPMSQPRYRRAFSNLKQSERLLDDRRWVQLSRARCQASRERALLRLPEYPAQ
jgi:hypothetical protein